MDKGRTRERIPHTQGMSGIWKMLMSVMYVGGGLLLFLTAGVWSMGVTAPHWIEINNHDHEVSRLGVGAVNNRGQTDHKPLP